jgi:hypothetical protein
VKRGRARTAGYFKKGPRGRANPMERAGWQSTPAGRYIDPETKRSYNAREALMIVTEREDAKKESGAS